jgi:hypothetical protein
LKISILIGKTSIINGPFSIAMLNYQRAILPTDELIFFRGVGQPPTSNVVKTMS